MRKKAENGVRIRQKKPHPIRHGIGMFFAAIFLIIAIILNVVMTSMGTVLESFVGGTKPQVSKELIAKTKQTATDLANEIETEGMVLLQNRENTLPFSKDIKKVNVFGWASTAWLGGGSGSGGVTSVDVDLLSALNNYGIEYNTEITDMYKAFQDGREYDRTLNSWPEQSGRLYEPSIRDTEYYSQSMLDNAEKYSDTALVVIGRRAGESNDATKQQYKRVKKDGEIIEDDSRTMLQLSEEEEELLSYAGEHFENVVVILNTTNVMAVGQIETTRGVDACILAGLSGQSAAGAIPRVLWGEEQPSGRTADTWAYDLKTAPSYVNAGLEGVGAYTGAEGLYPADGTTNGNLGEENYQYDQVSYTDYAEGIYIGYKWYETADEEGFWADVDNEYGKGYEGVVQYPFGYGLSYTEFSHEIIKAPSSGTELTKDGTVSVTVKVTNTGEEAGKDVVQLYYRAPYNKGEIEKSAVELAAFGKTDKLEPGESQEITLSFAVEDMASYDCYDANNNGFSGYELDPGEYVISVRENAHTAVDADHASVVLNLKENVQYPTDKVTGAEVTNKFTGTEAVDGVSLDGSDSEQNITYLSRKDFQGTYPVYVPKREISDNVAALNLFDEKQAEAYINENDKEIATEKKNKLRIEKNGTTTELGYQLGADYNDPKWDDLLDQLSIEEMEELFINAYGGTAEIKSIGKMKSKDADGPSQIGGFTGMGAGTGFPSSSTLAQTWNTVLAQEQGRTIGQQALQNGYSGWYAPAVNIHRSPFNGRNYEYYSEDSVLSGEMCGNTVLGANQAGTYTYVKHFICNDGEAGIYRDSVYIWMTEQTLREIYLKPFKTLVENYDGVGLMTSYNRIGAVWAGGSKALLTDVLRKEWGFNGAVITDYCDHHSFMNGDQALRAGGSLWMSGMMSGEMRQEKVSNTYYQNLRRAAKNTLYMYLHVRTANKEYSEKANDQEILRPVFKQNPISLQRIVWLVTAIAVICFVLAIRGLVTDHRLRKIQKAKKE